MIFQKTKLEGVFLISSEPHEDERGYFARVFCVRELERAGIAMQAVQINTSHNFRKHTLRGLHSQLPPHAETKIIRCVRGAVFDVAVDVRAGSPTFGRYVAAELTPENGKMLLVPQGFAHGYMTLCDDTDVLYFVSEFYAPGSERGYRFDDPAFSIQWPARKGLVLSAKDASWPYLARERSGSE